MDDDIQTGVQRKMARRQITANTQWYYRRMSIQTKRPIWSEINITTVLSRMLLILSVRCAQNVFSFSFAPPPPPVDTRQWSDHFLTLNSYGQLANYELSRDQATISMSHMIIVLISTTPFRPFMVSRLQ